MARLSFKFDSDNPKNNIPSRNVQFKRDEVSYLVGDTHSVSRVMLNDFMEAKEVLVVNLFSAFIREGPFKYGKSKASWDISTGVINYMKIMRSQNEISAENMSLKRAKDFKVTTENVYKAVYITNGQPYIEKINAIYGWVAAIEQNIESVGSGGLGRSGIASALTRSKVGSNKPARKVMRRK